MAKIPKFDVITLTLLEAGALKAYATVRVASLLTISEVRLIQSGDQAPWCSLPQKTWMVGDQRRYSTLVEFHEKAWREALTAAVVAAWRDHPGGIRPLETLQQKPQTFRDAVHEKAGDRRQQLIDWYESISLTETMQVLDLLLGIAPDDRWRSALSALRSQTSDMEYVCERLMDTVYLFSDEGETEKIARMPMPVQTWYERTMWASQVAVTNKSDRISLFESGIGGAA